MELVYRVSDTEEKVFELDIEDLDLEELGLIETYSGKTYEQIMESLGKGRGVFSILRPFLFVYLRRENPDIAYRDVSRSCGSCGCAPAWTSWKPCMSG